MLFQRHTQDYQARPATPSDAVAVQGFIAQSWRVYLRTSPEEVLLQRRPGLGWVTGSEDGISGFMLVELQPSRMALITAAAVSDDWRASAFLDSLLPGAEAALRSMGASALAQIGYAPWLTGALGERGFLSRDWVVTYEWNLKPVAIQGNPSVTVRSAHLRDLPTLLSLDEDIFGPIWHKPENNIEEAMANAFSFTVAEIDAEIVGYQWCEWQDRHGHLTRLAVRPDWEGRGVGTRLLTEALVALTRAGVNWITLNTQESNLRSRMLYERHGFRLTSDRVAVLWKDL